MFLVVFELDHASAVRFAERSLHGIGHLVGVHDHGSVDIASRTSDRLDEARPDRRKPSLSASRIATRATSGRSRPSRSRFTPMRTSYSPRRRSRRIWTRLEGVDVRVQISRTDAELEEVVGEILGHLLRERGHQHALFVCGGVLDLANEIVDLTLGRAERRPRDRQGPSGE